MGGELACACPMPPPFVPYSTRVLGQTTSAHWPLVPLEDPLMGLGLRQVHRGNSIGSSPSASRSESLSPDSSPAASPSPSPSPQPRAESEATPPPSARRPRLPPCDPRRASTSARPRVSTQLSTSATPLLRVPPAWSRTRLRAIRRRQRPTRGPPYLTLPRKGGAGSSINCTKRCGASRGIPSGYKESNTRRSPFAPGP